MNPPSKEHPVYLLNEKTNITQVVTNAEQLAVCKMWGYAEIDAKQYRLIEMIRGKFRRAKTERLAK